MIRESGGKADRHSDIPSSSSAPLPPFAFIPLPDPEGVLLDETLFPPISIRCRERDVIPCRTHTYRSFPPLFPRRSYAALISLVPITQWYCPKLPVGVLFSLLYWEYPVLPLFNSFLFF